MCSLCCRMETSGFSWLIASSNEHKSQKGIFWDLDWDHLESLHVAKDTQTQGTWWGGIHVYSGGQRPSCGVRESWAPVPYCFELQFQRKAPASGLIKLLSKKIKNPSCFRQIQTSHLRSSAHKTPKAHETKPSLERGSSPSKVSSVNSCLPCVHFTSCSCSPGKNSHSVFWNHLHFPPKGLAFACHSTWPTESRRRKYWGWEIIAAAAQKRSTVLCKHLWKFTVRQSIGSRCVESRMSPEHLGLDLLYEEVIAKKGEKLRSVCDYFFFQTCV